MSRRATVWACFLGVHVALTVVGVVVVPAEAFWDLDLYRSWAARVLVAGEARPVVDVPWVYPAGALVPVLLPGLVTTASTTGYALAWCVMVTALDAAAAGILLRAGHVTAVWWWTAFLAALGPVAIGRLDAVIVPMMVVGLLRAHRHPRWAAVVLTAGAWVKVAPGALLLAVVAVARRPVRDVVVPAAAVCVVVVAVVVGVGAVTGGGVPQLLSFFATQQVRGLQAEAVVAGPWVLASLWRDDVAITLNDTLSTFEVRGPGTGAAADVLDALLPVAVLAVGAVLWSARRRGTAAAALLPGALTLVLLLVVANKVGSPQFVTWVAAPVIALLAARDHGAEAAGTGPAALRRAAVAPDWSTAVAVLVLLAAGLTQVVFPWGYDRLLGGDAAVAVVLVMRNAVLLAVLALAGARLVRTAARRPVDRRLLHPAD